MKEGFQTMNGKALLWLVPIFITLHNIEEAAFMPAFLQARNAAIPAELRPLLPALTYRQFLIALIIFTAIPYLIAGWGWRRQSGLYLLLGLQVVMLINVLAHVMMAILIGGYAPGVATALVINLPFSLYLLRHALKQGWLSRRAVALMFPIGLAIHALGLPGLLILSGRL